MATTEVTDDEPAEPMPPLRLRHHRGEPPASVPRVIPIGAAWNQPPPVLPDGSQAEEHGNPHPFGRLRDFIQGSAVADDGEPRFGVRDLPVDVQSRLWRYRLGIMVVVGAVFAALTRSWEVALSLAILAGIIDTVYRSRTAANYRNGVQPSDQARRRTRRQIARLRREGFYALDARPIPDSREIIDHLIVGPTGVYAIDSERWNRRMPVRTQNGRRLFLGPESQKERLDHATWEAGQASEILSEALGTHIPVRPALAIYGPRIPWDVVTIRDVDVFTGSALRRYLKRRGRASDGVIRLTREQIRMIFETAARTLPDVSASRRTGSPVG